MRQEQKDDVEMLDGEEVRAEEQGLAAVEEPLAVGGGSADVGIPGLWVLA